MASWIDEDGAPMRQVWWVEGDTETSRDFYSGTAAKRVLDSGRYGDDAIILMDIVPDQRKSRNV